MIGVTPVGIFTYLPVESRSFYRGILGLEQVYNLREVEAEDGKGCILRLESPQIEVFSVEMRECDAKHNNMLRGDTKLIIHPYDFAYLNLRLLDGGVILSTGPKGSLRFEDLNGISWEVA
ncbi:MAG: hypothetical protein HQM09_16115 [Candidatus Riflebacteria bacterium]|nr:hypothetical protein [Candidatus Riflebacteria bacterium]